MHQAVIDALEEWRLAWKLVVDTTDAYNARVRLANSERDRGNWSISTNPEYQTMCAAQRAEFPAREKLYSTLDPTVSHTTGNSPSEPFKGG